MGSFWLVLLDAAVFVDMMACSFLFSVFRMAYGTEYGLVIIDIIQKICLLSVACPDLYGAHDPYSRTPKSPKRIESKEEQSRSPSSDQVSD